MGRKKKTLPQSAKAASSLEMEPLRGGKLTLSHSEALEREPEEPMTEADRAYTHAVEVCDRIVRELDEQLKGWKRHGKASDGADELLGREA